MRKGHEDGEEGKLPSAKGKVNEKSTSSWCCHLLKHSHIHREGVREPG